MTLSSNSIKIAGKFELPLPEVLEKDHDYIIGLEGRITGRNEYSNEDGTYSQVWLYKPLKGQIGGTQGQSVPLTSKGGQAFKIRCLIAKSFGMNYDDATNVILKNPDAFQEFLTKLMGL